MSARKTSRRPTRKTSRRLRRNEGAEDVAEAPWIAGMEEAAAAALAAAEAPLTLAELKMAVAEGRDLSGANLSGMTIRGLNMAGVKLAGASLFNATLKKVNLAGADLSGVRANQSTFESCNMSGAILSEADLTRTYINDTNLSRANLAHANLSHARIVRSDLSEAYLGAAQLDLAGISRTNLSGAVFEVTNLRGSSARLVNLEGAQMRGAYMPHGSPGDSENTLAWRQINGTPASLPDGYKIIKGTLVGPRSEARGLSMAGEDMRDLTLRGTELQRADLRGADLSGVDMRYAILISSDLREANLSGTNLRESEIGRVRFDRANMAGTDLREATIRNASGRGITGIPAGMPKGFGVIGGNLVGPDAGLERVDLQNADLSGIDLTDAYLTGARIDGAIMRDTTLAGVRSGKLRGKPQSLPPDWQIKGGHLVGPRANLRMANLRDVDLSGVDLQFADLRRSIIGKTQLAGASLSFAKAGQIFGRPASLPSGWAVVEKRPRGKSAAEVDAPEFDEMHANEGAKAVVETKAALKKKLLKEKAALKKKLLKEKAALRKELFKKKRQERRLKWLAKRNSPAQLAAIAKRKAQLKARGKIGFLVGPHADLSNQDLGDVNLSDTDLRYANFTDASLANADMRRARMHHATLNGANMRGANMSKADLANAVMNSAVVDGVELAGADMTGVTAIDIQGRPKSLPDGWFVFFRQFINKDQAPDLIDLRDADISGEKEMPGLDALVESGVKYDHHTIWPSWYTGPRIARQVQRSAEFRRWFGKSKVVDARGEPLPVYHGTTHGGFTAFDALKRDAHHNGFFFTSSRALANTYAGAARPYPDPTPPFEAILGTPKSLTGIVEVYLRIENPLIVDAHDAGWHAIGYAKASDAHFKSGIGKYKSRRPGKASTDDIAFYAKGKGFDGVIIHNVKDAGAYAYATGGYVGMDGEEKSQDIYIVFEPTQIKHAVLNTGGYDLSDPDIRKNPRRKTSRRARRTSRR